MAELDIVITATDNASNQIDRVSRSVSGLGKSGSKSFGRLASSIGKAGLLGVAGLAAGAVAGLGVGLKSAIVAGSEAEEMMSKFNVVFGEFAEESIKDLDAMAMAMGRNKFELRGFASAFQDTFVPMGFARDEAADLAEELTGLTVDLASFNNMAEPDVMNALQSALVGNHETMRQFGVVITQTTLDAELLRMGIENGIKAATEQEKVQARLNLIMAGTSDAQGDAARTADSWANQMRALKATLAEATAEIGLKLLPLLTPLLQKLGELATKVTPIVIAWIDKLIVWFEDLRTMTGEDLPDSIRTLANFWRQQLFPALVKIWAFIQRHIIPLFDALAHVWVAALKTEFAILASLFTNVLVPAMRILWAFIQTYIVPAFQRLDQIIGGIGNRISQLTGWIHGLAGALNGIADRVGGFGGLSAQTAGTSFTINQSFSGTGLNALDVERSSRNGVFDALRRAGR